MLSGVLEPLHVPVGSSHMLLATSWTVDVKFMLAPGQTTGGGHVTTVPLT